jgi:cystathionine beta-synthase
MRMFDVSQLPVLDKGRIVGMIDESDLLMSVFDNRSYFDYPVRDFMITRLETVQPTASGASLLPVFRGDHVAIIAEGDIFYGLTTQVDLINKLRHSMSNNG